MRFALMTEPQQGMSYADQLAIGQARRGDRLRGLVPVRPLRELPRARPAGRRPTPGPSWPGWPARPSGSASACSSRRSRSGIPACFAKVVTTVDEMSGGRIEVGVGAGWNEARAPPARARLPGRSRSGPTCSRTSWRSCTACGASRTAGRYDGVTGIQVRDALFRPRPVDVPGPARDRGRRRRGLGSSSAARDRHGRFRLAARYADEFNLSSSSPAEVADGRGRPRRRVPGDRPRPGDAWPDPRWSGSSSAATRRRSNGARAGAARVVRRRTSSRTAEAWLEERRSRWIFGTPDEARARAGQRFADAGRRADHAPGLPAVGPRHDRPHGRGAGRPGLSSQRRRLAPQAARLGGRVGSVGGLAIAVDIAVDRVGVDPAGPGEPLGQGLQRSRRPEQGRHGGRHRVGRLVDDDPADRRQLRRQQRVDARRDDRGGRHADHAGRGERATQPRRSGPSRARRSVAMATTPRSTRPSRRGGRAGTSRGPGRRPGSRRPPRP